MNPVKNLDLDIPSEAKRIALVLPCLLPFGGAERLALSQASEFAKAGCTVDFVLVSEPHDVGSIVPPGSRVFNLDAAPLRNCVLPFARYLRAERPDAVHVFLWPLTTLCLLAHRLSGSAARIVVSDHSILSAQYRSWGRLHRAALRLSLALTYRFATARVAVSRGVGRDVATLAGLQSAAFTVIHNPMPLPIDAAFEDACVEEAWCGWRGKRIITVGRLKPVKNHGLLIEAFRRLLETMDARLMILGQGELEETTRRHVSRAGLDGQVIMPGQVTNPIPFYRSADLFVLSSNYEGFGNVIVEALACGLPVVSTDCPSGPAEILENGRWGCLTPVGDPDALAEAMAVALTAPHDPAASRRRAADFAPENAARAYLELLVPGLASG